MQSALPKWAERASDIRTKRSTGSPMRAQSRRRPRALGLVTASVLNPCRLLRRWRRNASLDPITYAEPLLAWRVVDLDHRGRNTEKMRFFP
jgi:hypothetical protein